MTDVSYDMHEDEERRFGFRPVTATSSGGVDPYTGEPYDEREGTARGAVDRFARRRARRRARRGQRQERERERDLTWFREMERLGGENVGLADALAEGAPSIEDLIGGTDEYFMEDSALAGAAADPRAIEAQMSALDRIAGVGDQFQAIYDAGGYTDLERGQIDQALMQAGREDAARQGAIRQQMATQGMGGSGLQYAQQMLSQQGAANRGAEAATDIATAAQARALDALAAGGTLAGQQGSLAGQARGQSFDEAATRGSALDDFNRYNLGRRDYYQERRGSAAQQRFDNQATATGAQMGARTSEQDRYEQERNRLLGKKGAKWEAASNIAGAGADLIPL